MGLNFRLRRFRNHLVGAPKTIQVVTDHKPLCPIFNNNRKGSIRTERIKMRHQDIGFNVQYQKGKLNQTDYTSRRAKPIGKTPKQEQTEKKISLIFLYMLHTTLIMDKIGIANISKDTKDDPVLSELSRIIRKGETRIPKTSNIRLKKFEQIIPEIIITANGILPKAERIILSSSLQEEAIKDTIFYSMIWTKKCNSSIARHSLIRKPMNQFKHTQCQRKCSCKLIRTYAII